MMTVLRTLCANKPDYALSQHMTLVLNEVKRQEAQDTVNQRNSSISSSGGGGARKHARKHARKKSAAVWRQGAGALCASDSGSEVHLRDSSESILKAGAIDSGSNSSNKELSELKQ
eukprot:20620-Heterococcus_DN1.PRE.1